MSGAQLGELSPLFPRADKEAIQRMTELEQKNNAEPAAAKPTDTRVSKLQSLLDGLAVAMAESTNETAAVLAFQSAVAETFRETLRGGQHASSAPPNLAPGTANPPAAAPDSAAASASAGPAPVEGDKISIDDFAKVELRVAQVKVAERVPKADKLLRLEVDLGYETRQILAGIAESYTPESLIGRKVVIVANLAPRKLRGFESNGMIVAASAEGGKAVLAGFLEDVEIGWRLK